MCQFNPGISPGDNGPVLIQITEIIGYIELDHEISAPGTVILTIAIRDGP